ncbi:MAG4270 family putative restriction endonuclease [Mycoplasma sp. 5370]
MNNPKLVWNSFDVETKNYDSKTTTSASFKGKFYFIYMKESLVIVDYFFKLDECFIDLKTTERWFRDKIAMFKKRDELFNLLGFTQEKRLSLSDRKLVKLNEKELSIINNFLKDNFRNETIKNIITLVRGSNPAGELSKPENAPLILSKENEIFKRNFHLFFKNFSTKLNNNISNYEKIYYQTSLEYDYIEEFKAKINNKKESTNIFKNIYESIKIINSNDSPEKKKIYLNNLNLISRQKETLEKTIEKERSKINQVNVFPFSRSEPIEKAHFFPVYKIKMMIINYWYSNFNTENKDDTEINKLLNFISDKENYLNLSPTLHKKFDDNNFTFNSENGEIVFLDKENMNDYCKNNPVLCKIIEKIPEQQLTEKRKKFLDYRNQP